MRERAARLAETHLSTTPTLSPVAVIHLTSWTAILVKASFTRFMKRLSPPMTTNDLAVAYFHKCGDRASERPSVLTTG
jgi:hypothetical protein